MTFIHSGNAERHRNRTGILNDGNVDDAGAVVFNQLDEIGKLSNGLGSLLLGVCRAGRKRGGKDQRCAESSNKRGLSERLHEKGSS